MSVLDRLPAQVRRQVDQLPPGEVAVLPEHDLVVERTRAGLLVPHCIKCFARKLGLQGGTYSHQFLTPMAVMRWDIDAAWRLVRASRRPPVAIDGAWLQDWIRERSHLIAGHEAHIPPEALDEPILCDLIRLEARTRDTGSPVIVPFPMLLDGHHRAARAAAEGRSLRGYVLTAAEHARIVTFEPGAYEPELMGWMPRAEAEAEGDRWNLVVDRYAPAGLPFRLTPPPEGEQTGHP